MGTPTLWNYQARCRRVVDADTLDLEADLGFRMAHRFRARILGINAPEPRGATRIEGLAAGLWVTEWISAQPGDWPLRIHTIEADSFGRWLTVVQSTTGEDLATAIMDAGHAIPWH